MKELHCSSLFLGLILLILVVVSSCRIPFDLLSTPTPVPRNAWLTEWLEDPVCQPPCFMEIIPGVTTITETLQILSARPDVQITSGPLVDIDGTTKELSWDFTTPTQYDGARMITDEEGKTISIIDMGPGLHQSLTVADVITHYGPPESVYHADCRGRECVVHLVYLSSGMVLETFLPAKVDKNYKHSVDISAETLVGEIWFFPPGEDGYRGAFGFWADYLSESQLQWEGYTTYKEK